MVYTKSIMQTEKSCALCGRVANLERHHVFFGHANRPKSEKYGLWVWLCPECHRTGRFAVHRDRESNVKLKQDGQRAFERTHTRAEFMREFGRNWLDDSDDI